MCPEKAIKLGVNDFLRDTFCDYDRTRETMGQQVAAGALTAVVQVLATNPMEVMKIRLQMIDGPSSSSPLAVAKELGIRGLYNGITVTWMRDIPYNVIFFMTYIQLKRALTSSDGHVSQSRVFGSGVAAGVVAAWAGTPMDVVKSRIQMANSPYTNGAVDCMKRLHDEGGWRIFFRGAVPRMAVQGPLYGISLLCFELLNDYSKQTGDQR
jgi:solute carrier family 25 aspartate/glutamate transporter 12/13